MNIDCVVWCKGKSFVLKKIVMWYLNRSFVILCCVKYMLWFCCVLCMKSRLRTTPHALLLFGPYHRLRERCTFIYNYIDYTHLYIVLYYHNVLSLYRSVFASYLHRLNVHKNLIKCVKYKYFIYEAHNCTHKVKKKQVNVCRSNWFYALGLLTPLFLIYLDLYNITF